MEGKKSCGQEKAQNPQTDLIDVAIRLRSVILFSGAFECLTVPAVPCKLLKLRLGADSIPTAATILSIGSLGLRPAPASGEIGCNVSICLLTELRTGRCALPCLSYNPVCTVAHLPRP